MHILNVNLDSKNKDTREESSGKNDSNILQTIDVLQNTTQRNNYRQKIRAKAGLRKNLERNLKTMRCG